MIGRRQRLEILRRVIAAVPVGASSKTESSSEEISAARPLQRVWETLWRTLELSPPPALEEHAEARSERILQRCRYEAARRAPLRWSEAPLLVRVAAAAAAVAGLGLGLVASPPRWTLEPSPIEVAEPSTWTRWSQVTAAMTLAEAYAGEIPALVPSEQALEQELGRTEEAQR